ncbi:MAG: U32 family peptidase [Bacilli bacterium]|nr:U32 family peptidase [Bacilli bacterium]
MKLLVEVSEKDNLYLDKSDGIILPLEGYAVESTCFFTLEEVCDIVSQSKNLVFVKLNKNFMNEDIEGLKNVLVKLNELKVDGVFFYDLAVLQLKKELGLDINLVWNQTHMVNNYKTCDYYYSKGVKYALLGKEITLEEITEIIKKSKITPMVEVVSRPSVAFSKRKLVTNYNHDIGKKKGNTLQVIEKVTGGKYDLYENNDGTSFFLDTITNGTSIIKDLYDCGCEFIIMREYGLEDYFEELIIDTKEYILNGCLEKDYVDKYKKIGDSTNFFFRKTIYVVKKK